MTYAIRRGTVYSFDSSTYKALVALDGSMAHVELTVAEWVPKSFLAQDDEVAVLLFDDANPEDGVILGPYGAASGLLALTGTPSNGQLPIGNGSGFTLAGLTGTANQVNVANGAGSITLSTPQNLHSGASPTFAGLQLTGSERQATGAGLWQRYIQGGTARTNVQNLVHVELAPAGGNHVAIVRVTFAERNTGSATGADQYAACAEWVTNDLAGTAGAAYAAVPYTINRELQFSVAGATLQVRVHATPGGAQQAVGANNVVMVEVLSYLRDLAVTIYP